ncbi:MAG: hypothetical protein KJ077_36600 [Anaerolineae bacterium]|nr:hypothetical protein [Anaerolineae bacterium]
MLDNQQSIHPVLKRPIDSFHYWDLSADRMVKHLPPSSFTIVAAIKNEGNCTGWNLYDRQGRYYQTTWSLELSGNNPDSFFTESEYQEAQAQEEMGRLLDILEKLSLSEWPMFTYLEEFLQQEANPVWLVNHKTELEKIVAETRMRSEHTREIVRRCVLTLRPIPSPYIPQGF